MGPVIIMVFQGKQAKATTDAYIGTDSGGVVDSWAESPEVTNKGREGERWKSM